MKTLAQIYTRYSLGQVSGDEARGSVTADLNNVGSLYVLRIFTINWGCQSERIGMGKLRTDRTYVMGMGLWPNGSTSLVFGGATSCTRSTKRQGLAFRSAPIMCIHIQDSL